MNKISVTLLLTLIINSSYGQLTNANSNKSILNIGIEQDVLPYVLKGYIGTVWFGRDKFRYRLSYASASSPKFILADNIEEDRVKAFGISFEYFFKDDYKGLWFGPGVGVWTNYITSKNNFHIKNESMIATIGGGYNMYLTNWLYFSPWVAMHFRVSGNDPVQLIQESYKPAIITPELSLKLGIKLPMSL